MLKFSSLRRTSALAAVVMSVGALTACDGGDSPNDPIRVATNVSVNGSSDNQTGSVGQTLGAAASVRVTDQNGSPLAGAIVNWATVGARGSVNPATSTSDANGDATTSWTLGNMAGKDSLRATLNANGAFVTLTATVIAGQATTIAKESGDNQTIAAAATSAPLVVKITDANGNPVSGQTISWSVAGNATISSNSTTTGADGTTSITATNAGAGTYFITANLSLLNSVTFQMTGN